MADPVKMTSKTVFANERITIFPSDGPLEGIRGGTALVGTVFETDLDHARDLARLGHAELFDQADLDGDAAPLEPHHQVSEPLLAADRRRREARGTASPILAPDGRPANGAGAAGDVSPTAIP